MKKIIAFLFVFLIILSFTSCVGSVNVLNTLESKYNKEFKILDVQKETEHGYTGTRYYLCLENNESFIFDYFVYDDRSQQAMDTYSENKIKYQLLDIILKDEPIIEDNTIIYIRNGFLSNTLMYQDQLSLKDNIFQMTKSSDELSLTVDLVVSQDIETKYVIKKINKVFKDVGIKNITFNVYEQNKSEFIDTYNSYNVDKYHKYNNFKTLTKIIVYENNKLISQ